MGAARCGRFLYSEISGPPPQVHGGLEDELTFATQQAIRGKGERSRHVRQGRLCIAWQRRACSETSRPSASTNRSRSRSLTTTAPRALPRAVMG